MSPLAILSRGYSVIAREKDGALVRSSSQVRKGDVVRACLAAGGFTAVVENTT